MEANNLKKVTLESPLAPSALAAEAYKTLRTNLMFCGADKKAIAFTSCQPNEGKSTLVMNIAISLAEIGKKVLLIDADMRKSVIISDWLAGAADLEGGLSQYLAGRAELEESLLATQYDGLHIMLSGYFPPNPAELLDSTRFSDLIARVREEYDYVLVDNAPIGTVIDAAIVARSTDGIVMVVAVNKNSKKLALDCKKQLMRTGKPILGVVLNHTEQHSRMYYSKKPGYYGSYIHQAFTQNAQN